MKTLIAALVLAASAASAQQRCTNEPGDLPCSLQRVPEMNRFDQRFSDAPLSYEQAPYWHTHGHWRSGAYSGARSGWQHPSGHTGYIARGGRGGRGGRR